MKSLHRVLRLQACASSVDTKLSKGRLVPTSWLNTSLRQPRLTTARPLRPFSQSAYRYRSLQEFPSTVPLSASRSRLEKFLEDAKRILSKKGYEVELVGAYRRGVEDVNKATFLVVGQKDDRIPSCSSPEVKIYSEEMESIAEQLLNQGLLSKKSDAEIERYILSDNPEIYVDIHYVPRVCHGAARLFLTGDDSYIRFLKLLAMEGLGLTFNKFGLWKSSSQRTLMKSKNNRRSPSQGSLPLGISIESLDGQMESEGDRKMRETRKEMGLPEGLDISLNLGPPRIDQPNAKTMVDEDILDTTMQDNKDQVLIKIEGKGGEGDVLDVLGLVWIPPSMRTVKDPE